MNTQQINQRRKALLLIAPILFIAALSGGLLVSSQGLGSTFTLIAYAACAALVAGGYTLVKLVDRAVFPMSMFALLATSAMVLWRIYDANFGHYREDVGSNSLFVAIYSFIPVTYLFAFLFLSRFRALVYSLTIWLIICGFVVAANWAQLKSVIWPEGLDFLLLVVVAFQPIYIALIYSAQPYTATVNEAKQETAAVRDALHDMAKLSLTDELTGLNNRRFLADFWQSFASPQQHKPAYLSVLAVDVDYFKQFNDSAGHLAGDECLEKIASEIGDFAKDFGGHAVRYGGEEFLVLIQSEVKLDPITIADQLRSSVLDLKIPHPASDKSYVTVSIGASSGESTQSDSESHWLRAADAALYQAKSSGRNCSKFLAVTAN